MWYTSLFIFHFQVLDLVELFLMKQAGNPLVFSVIDPLLSVIEHSMSSDSNKQEQDYLRKTADIFTWVSEKHFFVCGGGGGGERENYTHAKLPVLTQGVFNYLDLHLMQSPTPGLRPDIPGRANSKWARLRAQLHLHNWQSLALTHKAPLATGSNRSRLCVKLPFERAAGVRVHCLGKWSCACSPAVCTEQSPLLPPTAGPWKSWGPLL